jgi:hypothetical protein
MRVVYQTYNVVVADATTGLITEKLTVRENYTRITGISIVTKKPTTAVENRYLTVRNSTDDCIIEETPIKVLQQYNKENRMKQRFWSVDIEAKNQKLEILTRKDDAGVLDYFIELRLERD